MRITLLALIGFVLAVASLALAQEEANTPAPEEAPASDTSSSRATDPSVSVTTESSPAPEERSTPAPTRSSSAAASPKSSSPAKTSSPAPKTRAEPPASVMPTKKSTPEATLREIENKWEASVMAHDPSIARAYLAENYRGVSSKGKVMTKASLLSEIKKDTDTYTSAKNGKLDVRIYDGKFAVIMGTSTETGTAKDGKAFKRNYRWTDAWVEHDGNWQCVASQALLVAK